MYAYLAGCKCWGGFRGCLLLCCFLKYFPVTEQVLWRCCRETTLSFVCAFDCFNKKIKTKVNLKVTCLSLHVLGSVGTYKGLNFDTAPFLICLLMLLKHMGAPLSIYRPLLLGNLLVYSEAASYSWS